MYIYDAYRIAAISHRSIISNIQLGLEIICICLRKPLSQQEAFMWNIIVELYGKTMLHNTPTTILDHTIMCIGNRKHQV